MCIDFKIFLNLSQNVVTLISSKCMMLNIIFALKIQIVFVFNYAVFETVLELSG